MKNKSVMKRPQIRMTESGNISRYFKGNDLIQLIWQSPQNRNEHGKVVYTKGSTYLRLLNDGKKINLYTFNLDKIGDGDILIKENISINLNDFVEKSDTEITNMLFSLRDNGIIPLK